MQPQLIDNVNQILRNDLMTTIKSGSRVSIAAASFSIYAFQELRAQLSEIAFTDALQVQHAERESAKRQIVGTSLCDVSIGHKSPVQHAKGMSLQEQIETALKRQMNATKQPRRKRELFS